MSEGSLFLCLEGTPKGRHESAYGVFLENSQPPWKGRQKETKNTSMLKVWMRFLPKKCTPSECSTRFQLRWWLTLRKPWRPRRRSPSRRAVDERASESAPAEKRGTAERQCSRCNSPVDESLSQHRSATLEWFPANANHGFPWFQGGAKWISSVWDIPQWAGLPNSGEENEIWTRSKACVFLVGGQKLSCVVLCFHMFYNILHGIIPFLSGTR